MSSTLCIVADFGDECCRLMNEQNERKVFGQDSYQKASLFWAFTLKTVY